MAVGVVQEEAMVGAAIGAASKHQPSKTLANSLLWVGNEKFLVLLLPLIVELFSLGQENMNYKL